jgi:hypothetical protein
MQIIRNLFDDENAGHTGLRLAVAREKEVIAGTYNSVEMRFVHHAAKPGQFHLKLDSSSL